MTPIVIEVPSGKLSDVLTGFRPHVVVALDRLIRIPDLTVGDDLQQVLDQGLYNPRLSALFGGLWVARFEHDEGRPFDAMLDTLIAGTFEERVASLSSDALLFWLSLLSHNYPLDFGSFMLLLRPPLDPGLRVFVDAAEHWRSLGSPVEVSTSGSVEL